MNTLFVFGNPDLPMDALPLRLLPALQERFPDIHVQVKDPNEDWNIPKELVVLDTVVGIDHVTVFRGLTQFEAAAHVSVHDFDAYANLRFLEKLGRLKKVTIIGVPTGLDEAEALDAVAGEWVKLDIL